MTIDNISTIAGSLGKDLHAEATNHDAVEHSATIKATVYGPDGKIVGTADGLERARIGGSSRNTVKLGRDGGVAGLLLGLWPAGVVGAFDVPLGHLAFDDAWCCARRRRAGLRRAISRRRKVSQRCSAALSSGKSALVRHGLAGDPERGDEADPVRVVAGVVGGVGHQGADRVVAAQVSPDLLQHQLGGLWNAARCGVRVGGS